MYIYVIKLISMNQNVITVANLLKYYYDNLNSNKNISDEDLSMLIEYIKDDLKSIDHNLN